MCRDYMHKLMLNVTLICGLCRRKSLFTMLSGAIFVTFLPFKIVPITIALRSNINGAGVLWSTLVGRNTKSI